MSANDTEMTSFYSQFAGSEEESSKKAVSPIRRLMYILHGRWWIAIIAGMVLAIGGGLGGYYLQEDRYSSTGKIRIILDPMPLIAPLPEKRRAERLEFVLTTNAEYLRNPRVVNIARSDQSWQALGRTGSNAEADFYEKLSVRYNRRRPIIDVVFEDADVEAAQIATRAVIEAYMQVYGENQIRQYQERIGTLEDHISRLNTQRNRIRGDILEIAQEFGAEDLTQHVETKLTSLMEIEKELRDAQMLLDKQSETIDNEGNTIEPSELTLGELAMADGQLGIMVQQLSQLETEVELSGIRLGPQHRHTRQLEADLEAMRVQVRNYSQQVRQAIAEGRIPIDRFGDDTNPIMNRAQLQERVSRLQQTYDKMEAEVHKLGRKNIQIEDLRKQLEEKDDGLREATDRLEHIRRESRFAGGIEVLSHGDPSFEPVNTGKRKQFAIFGFGVGGMMGFGAIVMLAAMDRRLRSSDEASNSIGDVPMLGILPTLPENMTDPEQAEIAGYAVHHIRTILQLGVEPNHTPILAITGPAPGSGKTSLSLALGMSFATSGNKTLLIDSDIAGGGLSYRLDAVIRRKVGQILLKDGTIVEDDLDRAVTHSAATGQRLGEALVELGIISAAQLDEVLHRQADQLIGLLDALGGEDFDECVAETDVPGLFVLPIGGAHLADMGRVSLQSLRRLLEKARQRFDTVVVDTGPVPGSVETSIIAAEADNTIVVMARGDQRPRVEASFAFLRSIKASIAGFVFNRAEPQDLARSTFSASLSNRPGRASRGVSEMETVLRDRANGFDPVAKAVVHSAPDEPARLT